MPHYLISYDLKNKRNYEPLLKALREWHSARLLESLWLAELRGPAPAIRDILLSLVDADDAIAVIELKPDFDWATLRTQPLGTAWLKRVSP